MLKKNLQRNDVGAGKQDVFTLRVNPGVFTQNPQLTGAEPQQVSLIYDLVSVAAARRHVEGTEERGGVRSD